MARYVRLSVDQAKHFLEEAQELLDHRYDGQTEEDEKIRNIMIDILAYKIKRAERK